MKIESKIEIIEEKNEGNIFNKEIIEIINKICKNLNNSKKGDIIGLRFIIIFPEKGIPYIGLDIGIYIKENESVKLINGYKNIPCKKKSKVAHSYLMIGKELLSCQLIINSAEQMTKKDTMKNVNISLFENIIFLERDVSKINQSIKDNFSNIENIEKESIEECCKIFQKTGKTAHNKMQIANSTKSTLEFLKKRVSNDIISYCELNKPFYSEKV